MSILLASLHSKSTAATGLAVFDSREGLLYLQIEDLPSWEFAQQLRGVAVSGTTVYVVSSASLRIYTIVQEAPHFRLVTEIVMPEWYGVGTGQADLLPIYFSETKGRVFLGSNALSCIYEFSAEGTLLSRSHLAELAPAHFPHPTSVQGGNAYGHIRSITESPAGDLLVTVAARNGAESGSIVNCRTGELELDGLSSPHGGLFHGDVFFLVDVQGGALAAYACNGRRIGAPLWKKHVEKLDSDPRNSSIHLRGLAGDETTVYSTVLNFQDTAKHRIRSRIVGFDVENGECINDLQLPDFECFRNPRVFSLAVLNERIGEGTPDSPVVFRGGQRLDAISHIRPGAPADTGEQSETQVTVNRDEGVCTEPVISVRDVSLSYWRSARFGIGRKASLLKGRAFHALKGVSFEVFEGEVVGLIGRNGSGKSTMGMLLAGTLRPDSGKIDVQGIVQLLSLGVGFRSELTGRDNVYVAGTLLGLSRREVSARMMEIAEFAEVTDFLDEPVKTYSAGMKSRLAFAIATATEPDILILDEILSTGDQSFRAKAENRMRNMREKARSVIIVSHNVNQLRKLCTRVVWLDNGVLIAEGNPKEILAQYDKFCGNPARWLERHPEVKAKVEQRISSAEM